MDGPGTTRTWSHGCRLRDPNLLKWTHSPRTTSWVRFGFWCADRFVSAQERPFWGGTPFKPLMQAAWHCQRRQISCFKHSRSNNISITAVGTNMTTWRKDVYVCLLHELFVILQIHTTPYRFIGLVWWFSWWRRGMSARVIHFSLFCFIVSYVLIYSLYNEMICLIYTAKYCSLADLPSCCKHGLLLLA